MGNAGKIMSKNDFITNKITAVFSLALLGVILLMLTEKGFGSSRTFIFTYYTVYVLGFAGIAGAILGVCKAVYDRTHGRDTSLKILTGHGVACLFAVLSASCFLLLKGDYNGALRFLYVAIPVLAVLYLIFSIYQREFFLLSVTGAAMALYFWKFAQFFRGSIRFTASQYAILALLLAAVGTVFILKREGGVLRLGKLRLKVFENDAEYPTCLISLLVFILVTVLAFFTPNAMIIYLALASIAYVFILAVYFAVRLM